MIRINLLPVRAAKKKETAKQQLSILGLSIVGVLLIFAVLYLTMLAKISTAKDEISRADSELQQLKTKIGEINNIKKLKDDVQKKLDVLNRLRKGKTGPALRLAALSDAVPEKLWLTSYSEGEDSVKLGGIAFSEELIATFMRNLEASEHYAGVELIVSEQVEIAGVKGKKFEITCKLEPPKK
ncbi:MAG: PilN domain-containing protein [Geobacter sp.]|nr:PilN domain-containing protein [Geobacter sp.]